MKTAIIHSGSYEKHNTGDGHPEQPKRVIAIKDKLKKRKDLKDLTKIYQSILQNYFK